MMTFLQKVHSLCILAIIDAIAIVAETTGQFCQLVGILNRGGQFDWATPILSNKLLKSEKNEKMLRGTNSNIKRPNCNDKLMEFFLPDNRGTGPRLGLKYSHSSLRHQSRRRQTAWTLAC